MPTPSLFGPVRQLGFISRDLDRSLQYFIDAWGIGPWYTLRGVTNRMLYKGQEVSIEMSIALANSGDMQFEIVAQHNDVISLYSDALAHAKGLHVQHVAVWHEDVAAIESAAHSRGWTSIFENQGGPGRSVFVTHPDAPMVCIEISDLDPFKEKVRRNILRIATEWDGTDPIREGLPA